MSTKKRGLEGANIPLSEIFKKSKVGAAEPCEVAALC
jgi:hypothetical protein